MIHYLRKSCNTTHRLREETMSPVGSQLVPEEMPLFVNGCRDFKLSLGRNKYQEKDIQNLSPKYEYLGQGRRPEHNENNILKV